MSRVAAITALAACASAAVHLAMLQGAASAPFVAYFAQLPLLFIGLAFGMPLVALASSGASLLVLLIGGGLAAGVFLLFHVLPSLVVTRQSLLWRQDDEQVAWYPPGKLAGDLVLVLGGVTVLGVTWIGMNDAGVSGTIEEAVREVAGTLNPAEAVRLEQLVLGLVGWLPAIVAMSWFLMTAVNAMLAQLLARQAGIAKRPTPDIATFDAPSWSIPLFAVALVTALVTDGWIHHVSAIFLLLTTVIYLFQGLGVVHLLVRRRSSSRLPLIIFYVLFVLVNWPMATMTVGLGILDDLLGLRRRVALS